MFFLQQFGLTSLLVWLRRTSRRLVRRVAEFGAAFVSPLDWVFRFLGRRLIATAERAEQFEAALLALLHLVSWPLRAVARLLGWILVLVIPSPVRQAALSLGRQWMRLGRRLVAGAVWCSDVLNLDRLLLWLVWLLRPLWYPLVAAGSFIVAWAATRPFKQLLWGMPAVLLLLPILMAAARGAIWGHGSVAARYRLEVKAALEQKDFERVQLFERKLAQLGVDSKISQFNTAQALQRDGNIQEAYLRMQRLAPLDRPGYPPAHIWLARHLLAKKIDVPADEAQRLIGAHLDRLAALGIRGPELEVIRAYWLSGNNRLPEAAELLKPLVLHNLPAAIERFRLDLALKRGDDAREDALAIRQHVQRQMRNGDSLSSDTYRWWAAAEEFLGDVGRARRVLRDWLALDPQNENARRSLATLSILEFEELISSPEAEPKELALRIREAFKMDNVPENVTRRVAILYQLRTTQPALVAVFEELAPPTELPPRLAEILGTSAAVGGEWQRALTWLEQAVRGDPKNSMAANNLAVVLLQQPKPPLAKALSAANRAVELSPHDFRFRETRGQILARLGQWQAAVIDLEFALNGMPDVPAIHRALGNAYDALGNKQLAAVHHQHAQ